MYNIQSRVINEGKNTVNDKLNRSLYCVRIKIDFQHVLDQWLSIKNKICLKIYKHCPE